MNKDYDEEIEYGEKGRTKHTTFINFKISEIVENGFYGIDVDKKESIFTSEILFLQCKYLGDEKNTTEGNYKGIMFMTPLFPYKSELKDDEDETLLAAPGKRHDSYLTPGSKGKLYTPEINDKRISGARKRSMRSKYSDESSRSTKRNIFPGLPDWKTISSGISEQNETTYNVEQEDLLREEKILANNKEFELMMETLKKKSLLK